MDKKLEKLLDNKRCFIFDLDGTLADTERIHWLAHNEILEKEYGIVVDHEHILKYLGKPEEVFLTEIEQDYNIVIKDKEKYTKKRAKAATKAILKFSEPFKYVRELLLQSFGIRVFLVSAQNKSAAIKMLQKWDLYRFFNESNSFFCDHAHPVKSDFYGHIMRILGNAEPNEVALFEDNNKYLKIAKQCGFCTVGIDGGFGEPITEADIIIDPRLED